MPRARVGATRQLEGEASSPLPSRESTQILPAHRGHETARDEEAEPGAARADARLGVGAAVELAEDLLLVGLRDADPLVGDADLDRVALALGADRDRAAARASTGARCRGGSRTPGGACPGPRSPQAAPSAGRRRSGARSLRPPARSARPGRRRRARRSGRGCTCRSPVSSRATLSSVSTIAGQPLRLRRDVAEEREPLLLAEHHVLAQQRLGEAVDRRERRAQLVRHRATRSPTSSARRAGRRRCRGTRRSGRRRRRPGRASRPPSPRGAPPRARA